MTHKTKDQLIRELAEMRQQVEELKRSEAERNRTEEALRQSERRYRTYVDLTKQFVWVTDASGQVVEDVPAFRRFTGQTYEEVKGMGWSNALHAGDLQRTLAVWSKAISTRTPYEIEFRMRRHDGVYVTLLAKGVPILGDDDRVLEWVGTCIDISERKRMEERLIESRGRFRAIANYTYDCENWFDPRGKLVWINPAIFRLSGYTVDECMAMTDFPLPLIDEKDRSKTTRYFAEAIQGLTHNDVEFRIRCKDGSLKWTAVSWQPIYDDNGSCLGHRSSVRDITDRKLAEEKIQILHKELEQRVMELKAANKDLKTFSYSLSHDLMTALVAIGGFSRRLLEKYASHLDEKGQQYVRRINRSSIQMTELLADLLTFFSFGPKKMEFSRVTMDEIVREVFEELKEIHSEQNIEWNIETPLPDARGDKRMVKQVFANLLSNAIKYSRPRETSVIEVGGWAEKEKNVYYVKDNGIGFPVEDADRIFEVFERLHPSEEFEGTGVGLAIVKRVIDRHGGEVWAQSKVDGGTTFYFSIPKPYPQDREYVGTSAPEVGLAARR